MTALDAVERTALLTAALRAAESVRADRLYTDPYAAALAGADGPGLLAEIQAATHPPGRPRALPSTPDYNAIRTRFLDDWLTDRAAKATTQVVIAPAGMDSRPYRLDWPSTPQVFEVDRPAVLGWKQGRLAGARPRVRLRPVPADLVRDPWEDRLVAAGYDPDRPSTWLLEGLLYYLPGPDAEQVLRRVAAVAAPGSRIAADIVNAAALSRPDMAGLLDVFAGWGCPWQFGTDEPEALFADHGFDVAAVQPGEPGADFGRWPDPVPSRDVRGVRRVFLVHGVRR